MAGKAWFTTRCLFVTPVGDAPGAHNMLFEERITLWRCRNMKAAIKRVEHEAKTYADDIGVSYTGLVQAFRALHNRGCSRGRKPPVSSSDLAM